MKKRVQLSIILCVCMIMIACNKEEADATEEINGHMEETVEIEMQFEEKQEEMEDLEEKDQEIYEEIIQLGSEDYDEIVELADEAIALLEKRSDLVELEKDSIEAAREEFEQIEPLIDDIETVEGKNHVEKMYDAMIARYEAYDDVYDSYSNSIRLTEDLYKALKEEEFQEKEVYSLISDVNNSYEDVEDAFDLFNTETNSFNHEKEAYYDYITEE